MSTKFDEKTKILCGCARLCGCVQFSQDRDLCSHCSERLRDLFSSTPCVQGKNKKNRFVSCRRWIKKEEKKELEKASPWPLHTRTKLAAIGRAQRNHRQRKGSPNAVTSYDFSLIRWLFNQSFFPIISFKTSSWPLRFFGLRILLLYVFAYRL